MFRLSINRSLSGSRGLEKFGRLLVQTLSDNHGVTVVGRGSKSDIHFCVIKNDPKPGAKTLLRIDGVYYDKARLSMNRPISLSITQADGVVYQSYWSKIFAETMLGVQPKVSEVILNGIDQTRFRGSKITTRFDKVFICCSHWRVNKRLKSIVQSFLEWKSSCDKNIGLMVVGKPDYHTNDPSVSFLGMVSSGLESLYRNSDYMCHICHLDACPNTVVEALSSGLPVLCNNIGGTPELVKSDGVIVELDEPFNFRPIQKMKQVGPASVKKELLIEGMAKIMSQDWNVERPDLDISVSAGKYFDFCMKLLEQT